MIQKFEALVQLEDREEFNGSVEVLRAIQALALKSTVLANNIHYMMRDPDSDLEGFTDGFDLRVDGKEVGKFFPTLVGEIEEQDEHGDYVVSPDTRVLGSLYISDSTEPNIVENVRTLLPNNNQFYASAHYPASLRIDEANDELYLTALIGTADTPDAEIVESDDTNTVFGLEQDIHDSEIEDLYEVSSDFDMMARVAIGAQQV